MPLANLGLKSGDDTTQQATKAGVILARVGFAMRGVLYAFIGIVTLYIGCGTGKSGTASQKGAMKILADEPGGFVMLVLVVVGFIGYGLWLLSMAIRGTNKEKGWKAILFRIENLFKALVHFALAAYAASMLSSDGASSSGSSSGSMQKTWTGKLMQSTGGRCLLGLIGAIVVIVAIMQLKKAWTAKFMEVMGIEGLRGRKRKFILIAGRVGYVARGLILGLVGVGVIIAAATSDASEAKGIDGTLREVASYPGGKAVLIFMAIGFWCFAAFQIACACWAKIE
mmetsp:Transcript_81057/g.177994  ORF Transcript_81057/g.177994 Transcript_81057/m.177994 type:complete len:283 (+) Transcript_81057:78-926(+)